MFDPANSNFSLEKTRFLLEKIEEHLMMQFMKKHDMADKIRFNKEKFTSTFTSKHKEAGPFVVSIIPVSNMSEKVEYVPIPVDAILKYASISFLATIGDIPQVDIAFFAYDEKTDSLVYAVAHGNKIWQGIHRSPNVRALVHTFEGPAAAVVAYTGINKYDPKHRQPIFEPTYLDNPGVIKNVPKGAEAERLRDLLISKHPHYGKHYFAEGEIWILPVKRDKTESIEIASVTFFGDNSSEAGKLRVVTLSQLFQI